MNPEHKKYILENSSKKSARTIAGDLRIKENISKQASGAGDYGRGANKYTYLCVILIIILGIISYANSFSNQFVWDDQLLIKGSAHIKNFSYIKYIFQEDLYYMTHTPTGYYRPIQTFSYMVDYFLYGYNFSGYHLTSLIIQILNALMVFYLCLLIIKDRSKSFFAAAFFCVHPAFVPIVAYISGRADLLGLFFGLSAISLMLKYIIRKRGKLILAAAVLLYILAIISKEYYLITPLFVILYMYIFRKEFSSDRALIISLLSMLSVIAVYMFLRLTILNFHQNMGGLASMPLLARLAVFPYLFTNYVFMLLFPVTLGMERKLTYASLIEPRFLLSYVPLILLILALQYCYARKQKNNLFFLGWFIVGIIPISNLFIPLKAIYADHWMYMASIGYFVFLLSIIYGISKFFRKEKLSKIVKYLLPVAIIGMFISITINENRYWRNEEILFKRLVSASPDASRPKFNLGRIYEEKGNYNKALELYNIAIKGFQGNALYFSSRGNLYRKLGDMEKSRDDLEMAVKIEPSNAIYRNDLGALYASVGMTDKARAELKESLRLDPDNKLARKNLDLVGESR